MNKAIKGKFAGKCMQYNSKQNTNLGFRKVSLNGWIPIFLLTALGLRFIQCSKMWEESFSLNFVIDMLLKVGHPSLYVTFSVRPSVHPSVHVSVVLRAPYLRNRTLSDHNFWYTYVK